MAERLVLSTSSISSYLSCHRKYLFSSVYRISGGQSIAAALGSAVHAGAEAFWKSPLRPQKAMRAVWESQLALVPLPYEEPPEGALADAERMLGTYIGQVAPTFTPTLIEEPFLITVDGVALSGVIDAADPTTKEDLHDLKTVSMISKFDPLSYTLQLSLYSLGYRALTGHKPRRLLLDVLPRRGKVTYRQVEVQPEIGELLDVIGVVHDGIMAEDYSPTGATGNACKWCSYKAICSYSTEET